MRASVKGMKFSIHPASISAMWIEVAADATHSYLCIVYVCLKFQIVRALLLNIDKFKLLSLIFAIQLYILYYYVF